MAFFSTGIDIVSIPRIREAARRDSFLKRVFTEGELEYALGKRSPHKHLAGRFAAKEACLKALSTGLARGITWQDMEVVRDEEGRPSLRLASKAKDFLGKRTVSLSISYTKEFAFALVSVG